MRNVDRKVSVGRRLLALIVVQLATAILMSVIAVHALRMYRANMAFTQRFVLAPVSALGNALTQATELRTEARHDLTGRSDHDDPWVRSRLASLTTFLIRYRFEWQAADNPSSDAVTFRALVHASDKTALLTEEHEASTAAAEQLKRALQPEDMTAYIRDLRGIEDGLNRLLQVNLEYLQLEHVALEARTVDTSRKVIGLATIGAIVSAIFGLFVRRAFVPRLQRLVKKIRVFQEKGVNERLPDQGRDEIATLANALDSGFCAIEARDRERERFLAVVAHELKTPLTAVVGYSQAAFESRDEATQRKALEILRRQAARLSRLVDEVLLAARVRSGALMFQPRPVDLVSVLQSVIQEMSELAPSRRFEIEEPPRASALGDEDMLGHSFWGMLSYATAVLPPGTPVRMQLAENPASWQFKVPLPGIDGHVEEWERAFSPFGVVEYEGGRQLRSAIGLFLAREVARLHGGSLKIQDVVAPPSLVMDLPL